MKVNPKSSSSAVEGEELRNAQKNPRSNLRRSWVKRCLLSLRNLLHLSVELGRGRLVEPRVLLKPDCADRIEKTESAKAVNVASVLGHVKRHLDVAHGTEVVHLIGPDLEHELHQARRVLSRMRYDGDGRQMV